MTEAPSGPFGPFQIPEDFAPEDHGWSFWQELRYDAVSYARNKDPESGIQEALVVMRHVETRVRGALYSPTKDMGDVTLRQVWDAIGVDPEWSPEKDE